MARNATYSNPVEKNLRLTWTRSKAQARLRGEEWLIDWEDYYYLWTRNQDYKKKGRSPDSICLARIDTSKGWHVDNVSLEPRSQHLQRLYTGVPKPPKKLLNVAE